MIATAAAIDCDTAASKLHIRFMSAQNCVSVRVVTDSVFCIQHHEVALEHGLELDEPPH